MLIRFWHWYTHLGIGSFVLEFRIRNLYRLDRISSRNSKTLSFISISIRYQSILGLTFSYSLFVYSRWLLTISRIIISPQSLRVRSYETEFCSFLVNLLKESAKIIYNKSSYIIISTFSAYYTNEGIIHSDLYTFVCFSNILLLLCLFYLKKMHTAKPVYRNSYKINVNTTTR